MKYHYFLSYYSGYYGYSDSTANFGNAELVLDHPIEFKDIKAYESEQQHNYSHGYTVSVINFILMRTSNEN